MDCGKLGVNFRVDVGYCGGDPIKQSAPQPTLQTNSLTYKLYYPHNIQHQPYYPVRIFRNP